MHMTAYMIFTRESTSNPAELAIYSETASATLAGHPVTPRAFYGHHEVVEGPAAEGVVVLEFPTFADAKAWYNSPAYSEAREHRFKGANYRVIITEGV
jgi:uncharacterized protein (DUF1330 family)